MSPCVSLSVLGDDLPDLAPSAKALTHVTKNRAAPQKRNRARPQRRPRDAADGGGAAQSSHDLFVTAPPEADDNNEADAKPGDSEDKHDDKTDAEVAKLTALMPSVKPTSSGGSLGYEQLTDWCMFGMFYLPGLPVLLPLLFTVHIEVTLVRPHPITLVELLPKIKDTYCISKLPR